MHTHGYIVDAAHFEVHESIDGRYFSLISMQGHLTINLNNGPYTFPTAVAYARVIGSFGVEIRPERNGSATLTVLLSGPSFSVLSAAISVAVATGSKANFIINSPDAVDPRSYVGQACDQFHVTQQWRPGP